MQTIKEGEILRLRTFRVGKCPLDDYPMSVEHGKVGSTMCQLRQLRLKDQKNLLKASQVSETLYRHSKRMFDYALSRAGENDQVESPSQSRSFSGPTRGGSPIFNKRIQVMNAIRTRPVTVPSSGLRYKHERGGKMLPVIKQTLAQSNEDFRVKIIPNPPKSVCQSQRSSHPDVLLIPTAPPADRMEKEVDDDRHDVIDAQEEDVREEENFVVAAKKRSLTTRRGSEARRRQPRHWVDDLTVSSIRSNQDQPEEPEQTTQGQGREKPVGAQTPTKPVAADGENVNLYAGVNNVGENCEIVNSDGLPDGENLVLTLQELQEKQLPLPEFKCPSSEEKSREYAIREWLKYTSFSIGNKNVPLL